jgi:hydrogenase nickel incorporation protein HypA/HybF
MHELAITESILKICLENAEAAHADCITDIHIVIGELSSFVDEAIEFYWDIIADGTLAVGATLHFHRIKGQFRCAVCQTCYPISTPHFVCPACGSVRGNVIAGDELYVRSIEVE